jgi:hypothetical protein
VGFLLLFYICLLVYLLFISVTSEFLKHLIKEVVSDVYEQQRIDTFISEFKNFDVKEAKIKLKSMERKLIELKKNASKDLFTNENKRLLVYRTFLKKYSSLKSKIAKYEEEKHIVNSLVIKHKDHVLKKHNMMI